MRAKYLLSLAVLAAIGLALGGCAWLFAPQLEAVLSADPTKGEAPLSVEFDLSGSSGPITSYSLSFGDDSDPATGTDVDTTVVHTYDDPGTYQAELVVQDARGNMSTASVSITVVPEDEEEPEEPTASLSLTKLENGEVEFHVQGWAAEDKNLVAWTLYFDHPEDEPSTGEEDLEAESIDETVLHTYDEAGEYTAKLVVEDEDGLEATATTTFTVTLAETEITSFEVTDADAGEGTEEEPYELTVGQAYEFEFTAAPGAGREIAEWRLAFGDGTYLGETGLSEDSPFTITRTHTYTQTDSYVAVATVWDDADNSASEEIHIEAD